MAVWVSNRVKGIRNCPYFLTNQANPSTYETLDKHVILGYPRDERSAGGVVLHASSRTVSFSHAPDAKGHMPEDNEVYCPQVQS